MRCGVNARAIGERSRVCAGGSRLTMGGGKSGTTCTHDLRRLWRKWHQRELRGRGRVRLMVEKDRFNMGVACDDVIAD